MIRDSMVDFQLKGLGLSEHQIHAVKTRISNDKIPKFIEKMKYEKSLKVKPVLEKQERQFFNPIEKYQQESFNVRSLPEVAYKKSVEMNEKYQEYTNNRNNIGENLEIMSIRLFGDPPDKEYTEIFLKKKYKILAIRYHPDKNDGDTKMFTLVQQCYEYLYNKLPQGQTTNKKIISQATQPPKELFKNEGFDVKHFNSYYNKNALKDETKNHGYGDWLKHEDKFVPQEKVSMSNFNQSFESNRKRCETTNPNILSLIKKKEPPKEVMAQASLGNSVLGEEILEDYSGATSNGMGYTDLKRAHEMTHLIYNTEELSHENISFEEANSRNKQRPTRLLDSEYNLIEEMKRGDVEGEKNRQYRLRQLDEDISQHYIKVNRLELHN